MHRGRNLGIFMLTDFGAYSYHRLLHTFEKNLHAIHHQNPSDNATVCKASIVSGTAAVLASRFMGRIPVIYWVVVTVMHPLMHTDVVTRVPGLNYLKARHEKHHEDPSKNFGPFFPIFDLIFNTEK